MASSRSPLEKLGRYKDIHQVYNNDITKHTTGHYDLSKLAIVKHDQPMIRVTKISKTDKD